MGEAVLDQTRNEHVRPFQSFGLMHGRQHEEIAGLELGGRVHAVNVTGQEEIGDQTFKAVVLGGQERELLDVGEAVLGPLVGAA